jgi:hypothetical protein
MRHSDKVVRLRSRRSTSSRGGLSDRLLNRLLGGLLVAVLAVGAFALWRGTTENPSQPHVPTWKGRAQ